MLSHATQTIATTLFAGLMLIGAGAVQRKRRNRPLPRRTTSVSIASANTSKPIASG